MSPGSSSGTTTCSSQHRTSPPPPDRLYTVFEDTIAAVEELVFPIEPELSVCLLSPSSQIFLENVLDQLIRWGVDIYGRSGSLRAISQTFTGQQVELILARMQDELNDIYLRAQQWHRISRRGLYIGRSQMQILSQALVNLRGFTKLIYEAVIKAHQSSTATAAAALDTLSMAENSDMEEGEIVRSIDGDGEDGKQGKMSLESDDKEKQNASRKSMDIFGR